MGTWMRIGASIRYQLYNDNNLLEPMKTPDQGAWAGPSTLSDLRHGGGRSARASLGLVTATAPCGAQLYIQAATIHRQMRLTYGRPTMEPLHSGYPHGTPPRTASRPIAATVWREPLGVGDPDRNPK